ncbi:hypothetical protein M0R72_09115 [Candidatus Pacearchaeota archaeon]|jgi:hypothetical protein|nr:hypothetical protein [Candidatus Pacearchaeota archaeon]
MSASVFGGPRAWGGGRDDEGYREYKVTHLVKTTSADDGPTTVMFASGLPQIGALWQFGNDNDQWAFCYPWMNITPHDPKEGEKHLWWMVEQKFSTKPLNRCQDTQIEDPLLEPQKVSGSFVKYSREAWIDRNGNLLKNTAHEPFRGPQVEFDCNRPTVRIEQNISSLGLATFTAMIDTVNNNTLWGLPKRCIKLSNASWQRQIHGTCDVYYTRTFDFDIRFETFDVTLPDEGTKVLNGHWVKDTADSNVSKYVVLALKGGGAPSYTNPQHFIQYLDMHGNPGRVFLNGKGLPANTTTASYTPSATNPTTGTVASGDVYLHKFEFYGESNFLTLGIPTQF